MQVEDEIWQLVVGGSEVDRSFKRRVEKGRPGFDEAVLGSSRTGLGGELDPGADRPDVSLVEEGRAGQSHDQAFDVCIAFPRRIGRQEAGMTASFRTALELQGEVRLEAEVEAVGRLVAAPAGVRG